MSEPVRKNRPRLGLYRTERDEQVIKALWRYRIARESTLHHRCFPTIAHQKKAQARLLQLCEEGYLGRNSRQMIYWAERRGVEEVLNSGRAWDEIQQDRIRSTRRLFQRRERKGESPNLNHPLDIVDVRACLEMALDRTPDVLLPAWIEEGMTLRFKVKIHHPETEKDSPFTLCPDACFALQDAQTKKQEVFFLEVDEGYESATKRWRDKVLGYIAFWNHGGFKGWLEFSGQGFRVLTICRSETGKEQWKRKATLLRATFRAGGRGQFWFTTFDELMPGGVVTGEHFLAGKIWQRARKEEVKGKVALTLRDYLFT
jgi:hypothetical protein